MPNPKPNEEFVVELAERLSEEQSHSNSLVT